MRKRCAIGLAVVMLAAMFAGCGSTPYSGSDSVSISSSSGSEPDSVSDSGSVSEPADTTGNDDPDFSYSGHSEPDESSYATNLADLSKLSGSAPLLAWQAEPVKWEGEFSGWELDEIWGYDMRSCDMSKEDFSQAESLDFISFDSQTIWPDSLPDGFLPEKIMECGKNPGLSIRSLHEQGITGRGVGIAIIDQGLYTGHSEYADNLAFTEAIHCSDSAAAMHGSAVASIAAGKTLGVAPDADLYYICSTFGHFTDSGYQFDASIMADCILRVCQMNEMLPSENKIRVISISKGYGEQEPGFIAMQDAIRQADEQGILVLTTTTGNAYPFSLWGVNRDSLSDPDDPSSYYRPNWQKPNLNYSDPYYLFFPMGSRTYASCTGAQNYEFGTEGGLSWAVPWCAGLYALCCQAKPDITPSEFIELIKETATACEDQVGSLNIVNPKAVIARLQER